MKQAIAFLLFVSLVCAAGSSKVALIDRSHSPVKLSSVEQFNFSSRLEISAAVVALSKVSTTESDSATAARLGLKKVNRTSINRWKSATMKELLANFTIATPTIRSPVHFPATVSEQSLAKLNIEIGSLYPVWNRELLAFYTTFWYEQERLAALWPSVSSEIFLIDSCGERNGLEQADRTFLLTFDDGPTPPNGPTDAIISTLREKKIAGIFFVLSGKLNEEKRLRGVDSLKKRYAGMKVGSHGQEHSPYPKLPDPVGSLNRSLTDIGSVFPTESTYFRPPYGQRTKALAKAASQKSPVMLWNIDSQDWRKNLTAQQLADRTISLMVMHRRGIVLFHDLYDHSAEAVDIIVNSVNGITWR